MFTKEFQIRLHLNSILEKCSNEYIIDNRRLGFGYSKVPRKDCATFERKIFELYQKIVDIVGKHELVYFRLDTTNRWVEIWLDENSPIGWFQLTNYRLPYDDKTGNKLPNTFI